VTNLRRCTVEDAAELTRLRGLMHTAMGSDPDAAGWRQACEAAFTRRLAQPDRFAAFVVELEGRAVSSGVGWLEEHLPQPGTLDGRRGHLASMSTEPAHQRCGHGRAVLTALMGWFADLGVPRVDLRATEEGRGLYESFGFRVLAGATMAWTAAGTPGPGLGLLPADAPDGDVVATRP
jgi:ribosomal protein S18 acetylase RimI-like enzyme